MSTAGYAHQDIGASGGSEVHMGPHGLPVVGRAGGSSRGASNGESPRYGAAAERARCIAAVEQALAAWPYVPSAATKRFAGDVISRINGGVT